MTAERSTPGRPRSAGHVSIAIAVALLGFLLATQLRVQEGLDQRLAIEREADLVRILADLSTRSDRLLEEIIELRIQLAEAESSTARSRVLIDNAQAELDTLRVLLGTVPVTGDGVALTIIDPQLALGPDVLLDVLQELRDSGAEAVDINGVRAIASTSFGGSAGALTVDGKALRLPYVVRAIGDPPTMAEAMRIPGGVVDSIQSRPGAQVQVEEERRMSITSLQTPPSFSYARPAQRR